MYYVRFEDRLRRGLFGVVSDFQCYTRRRPCPLSLRDSRELEELRDWLWRETPTPGPDVYRDAVCRNPLTWFRPERREHIHAAWRIAAILRRYRWSMRAVRSLDPGRVIYEDEVQVVVRPHRGTTLEPATPPLWPRPEGPSKAWNGDRTTIRRWSGRARRRSGWGAFGSGGVEFR